MSLRRRADDFSGACTLSCGLLVVTGPRRCTRGLDTRTWGCCVPPNVTVAHAGCHARHVGPGRACGPAAAESHASPTYGSPVWPIWSPAISNRRRPARRATFMVCDCSVCSTRSSRTASDGAGQCRRPLRRGKGARHAFSRSKTADVRGQSGSLRALRIAPASVANTEQLSMDQEATSSHGETLFRET